MNLKELADRICSQCTENGISVSDMLAELNLGDSFISDISQGYSPSISKIHAIATFLNCSIDWLCNYGI